MKQLKLLIFDKEEKLVCTLENKDANTCPIEKCEIKEKLNGEFTLEFEIPMKHDDLKYLKEKYFVVVEDADEVNQLFIIQEIEDSHENILNKSIFCDHASIELADEVIEEVLIDRKDASTAFQVLMLGSKWEIGTLENTTEVHDITVRIKNRREVLETFLNRWNVEVSYSVELVANTIFKRLIHIHLERGEDLGKRLQYGHNIDKIRRTINCDFLKTALYGLGKDVNAENTSVNEAQIEDDSVEETKRYVDFGGLDWSVEERIDTVTGTKVIDENLLPSYQTKPTRTTDLNPFSWDGDYQLAIVNDAPNLPGFTKSFQIRQVEESSDFLVLNTARRKQAVETGKTYGFSFYVKANRATSIQLVIEFYNSKGQNYKPKTGEQRIFSLTKSVAANVWTRIELEKVVPSYAKLVMVEARYLNANVNDYMRVTAFNVTRDKIVPFVERIAVGGQPYDKPKGQKWIGDEESRLKWGRYNPVTKEREHIYGIYKNNSIDDPTELLHDTKAQLDNYKNPLTTYEVTEVNLAEALDLPSLRTAIGDRVHIVDEDIFQADQNENLMLRGYDTFDDLPLGVLTGQTMAEISGKYSLSGGKSLKVFHATGTNNAVYLANDSTNYHIPVEPNVNYILSVYAYSEVDALIQIHFRCNSQLGASLISSGNFTVPQNKWTRFDFSFTNFADATSALIRLDVDQANTNVWFDNIQLERAQPGQTKASEFKRAGDIYLKARAIERESDLIEPEKSKVVFGDFQQFLTLQQLNQREEEEARIDNIVNPPLPQNTIEQGAPIMTDWLEGEIKALQNEVIAGNGTVTITEDNGILIETIDKTGALRLLGGMLALSNERDPVTGEYIWRSFGTADGFLADLVQTGFIRWERAKGGQLTLGGEIIGYEADGVTPIYENGSLVVIGAEEGPDGEQIVVNLNGNQGGFDKLAIGELTNLDSTNIITRTFDDFHKEVQDSSGDLRFYVDPIKGDDNNIGTSSSPKSTVQSIIDSLPKYLDRNIWIYCLPTLLNDNEILIEGFIGHGYIYIELWDVGSKVRYVRDYLAGNSVNSSNHWVEVYGVMTSGETRHAGGNTYPERVSAYVADTGENVTSQLLNPGRVSNGITTTTEYSAMNNTSVREDYVQVYLGGVYDMSAIVSMHYYSDGRTYHKTKVEVAENVDGPYYTVFDSQRQGEYAESSSGHKVELKYFILNGRVKVNSCSSNVRVQNAWVNGEGVGNPTIDAYHTNFLELRDCVVFGDPTYDYAVYANGSNVRYVYGECNFAENSAICSAYGGSIEVFGVKGSGFPYGLYAHSTGKINGGSYSPYGSTSHFRTYNGGRQEGAFTPTTGIYYKAPIVQKTTTWTANDTQSLYGTNWTLTSNIYQGKRPTETTAWYGVMFFNARDFSTLSGRAIRKVRLKLQRSTNTGENTSRKPKIYYNMQSQAGGSISTLKGGHTSSVGFTWGQEKWIDLPISYGEAFRDGTALSLVLWVGSSESSYMKMEPKATLEITHG